MISLSDPQVAKGAVLSTCQTYRYTLQRFVKPPVASYRWVAWVLNNPSTADHDVDDATVRRAWAFTQAWGYNGMYFVNTNPYRSTNPHAQKMPPSDVLAFNDSFLIDCMSQCQLTVCAWGGNAMPELVRRAVLILHGCGPLHALRVTKAGNPTHPLYLPGNLQPQQWTPNKWLQ